MLCSLADRKKTQYIPGINNKRKINEWRYRMAEMQVPSSSYILLLPFAQTSAHAQAFHRNANILATWNVLWTKRHNITSFCICIDTFHLASFYREGEECKLPFLCCMSQLFWKLLILRLELKSLMDAPHHWLFWSETNCQNSTFREVDKAGTL